MNARTLAWAGGGRRRWHRLLAGSAALVVAIGGAWYWHHVQRYVATDDAYVDAHVVQISAQVSGQVVRVAVENNQSVSKGALLFEIDPAPYALKVQEAQTQLALARQQVREREAAVTEAAARLAQRQAELAEARSRASRILRLAAEGVMSPQAGDQARTTLAAAQAAVSAAQAALRQAQAQLGIAGEDNPQIQAAQARLAQAQLDLEHTRVIAPDDGYVTEMSLRPGAVVAAGSPLFAFVAAHDWWLDANYKETQLEKVKPGDPAEIVIDMYPHRVFHGVVDSISRGSGTAFSLLPPENATGNWVKVTQRVPVKVRITDPDPRFPLRVGTSGRVTIDVGG
ncbi:MAG: HlyD family secretion protein [Sinobacteraceae bacterium]|nr:HlyD family secretion protein [Nevskiaceae bacterium]